MICPAMRSGLALVIGVIVSMWLAPPVYWMLQAFSEEFPFLGALSFHRVWRRILLVCTIGALLVSLKTLDFGKLHLQKNRYRWYDFGWGFLFAAAPMVLLMATYVHFDVCRIKCCVELSSLLRVTARAIGVSIFEETLFRGLLYGLSRQEIGALTSALWTSWIFAILHLIHSSGSTHPVDIWSGWRELQCSFNSAMPPSTFLFALVSLTATGLLLCWATEQTCSLALPIGLHVGWIFVIQTGNFFVKFQMETPGNLPWVGPHVISGTTPVGVFAILAFCFTFYLCWRYLRTRGVA
jgi:membrane protease YdiL (CAAX protease family)